MTDHDELDPMVPDPERVLEVWAGLFRLTRDQVVGRRRMPRHVACRAAVAHELHGSGWYGVIEIADLLERDHSSICHLLKNYGPGGRRRTDEERAGLRLVGDQAAHDIPGQKNAAGGA